MRKKVIAGNWKMYKDLHQTEELVAGLKSKLTYPLNGNRVIVCPPYTSLALVCSAMRGTAIEVGAQNMYPEDEGAFTGEISPKMISAVGAKYVILGHSERRQFFGETNESINKKLKKTIASGLIPIVCVGELLEERETGITEQVISVQLRACLKDISESDMPRVIIAYEPVWAIGTGKTATPLQAQEVHLFIRKLIGQLYGWPVAEQVIIQYGGSVKPENAKELLSQPDIDGALVGGACLKADSFDSIIKASL